MSIQSKQEQLDAMKAVVYIDEARRALAWKHDGRGRYMRKGELVSGDRIRIGGKSLCYFRVTWALLTGQVLEHKDILDRSPDPSNYKKWRVVSRFNAGQIGIKKAAGLIPAISRTFPEWVDYTGKKCKPVRPRGPTEESGYDLSDDHKRDTDNGLRRRK